MTRTQSIEKKFKPSVLMQELNPFFSESALFSMITKYRNNPASYLMNNDVDTNTHKINSRNLRSIIADTSYYYNSGDLLRQIKEERVIVANYCTYNASSRAMPNITLYNNIILYFDNLDGLKGRLDSVIVQLDYNSVEIFGKDLEV